MHLVLLVYNEKQMVYSWSELIIVQNCDDNHAHDEWMQTSGHRSMFKISSYQKV